MPTITRCLLPWLMVCARAKDAAAWDNVLRAPDEAAVQHAATIGNGYLAAAVSQMQFVEGRDGSGACPPGGTRLSEQECRDLPGRISGTVLNNPFLIDTGSDPSGCFKYRNLIYFNRHRDGSPRSGRTVQCKRQGQTAYLAGVFSGPDADAQEGDHGEISHRAAVPAPLLSGPAGRASGELDLQRGVYIRKTQLASAPHVTFEQRIYAHRLRSSLLIMEYAATWEGSLDHIDVSLDLAELSAGDFQDFDSEVSAESLTITVQGEDVPVVVWRGRTRKAEAWAQRVDVAMAAYAPRSVQVREGEWGAMVAAYRTSLHCFDAAACALEDLQQALTDLRTEERAGAGQESKVFQEHALAWDRLWQSGLSVAGRPDVEQAVKSSTYYILSSLREDRPYSLSPGGLASNAYNGHTFWDTETWMYPALLAWYPSLARSLLDYRVARLPAARAKARSYRQGYEGAMFAWESAFTGAETCPTWAPTGKSEQHISADIAFAVRQYFHMTGDREWLHKSGFQLLSQVADFYASKAVEDKQSPGRYHIENVIPPDEYHEHVRDSVYTNFVAKEALLFAVEAADLLGRAKGSRWTTVADGLVLPYDDRVHRHPEYEGYHWGQKIKQADVVLLAFPLGMRMSQESRLADLDYYAQITDPEGPAMTWGMHAIGYLDAGRERKASENFNRSFANVKQPFLVWTETPEGGATNFITGAGGFLQTVMFGYFGLRIHAHSVELRPKLMDGASEAELKGIHYLGRVLSVRCSAASGMAEVSLEEGAPLRIQTEGAGEPRELSVWGSASAPLGSKLTLSAGPGAAHITQTREVQIPIKAQQLPHGVSEAWLTTSAPGPVAAGLLAVGLMVFTTSSVAVALRCRGCQAPALAPEEQEVVDGLLQHDSQSRESA